MTRNFKLAFLGALSLICVHLLAVFLGPWLLLINLLIIVAPLAAAVACVWRARKQVPLLKDKWRLLALGFAVWGMGQAWYTHATIIHGTVQSAALPSDFWFLTYGIFILLAVSSVSEDQDSTAILVADSAQAILAIVLIYVTLFKNTRAAGHPMPAWEMNWLYLAENLALAVTATLRMLAMPDGEDHFFHRTACVFTWLMLLASTPLNYLDVYVGSMDGRWMEVGWELPFLAVFVLVCSRDREQPAAPEKVRSLSSMVVYNASPVFFTICVLLLSAHLAEHRRNLGFTAVVLALLIYTFRASILQTRLRQVQQELNASERALKVLNSKLHEQSLADPLTAIANRRHFEQTFEVEWNRAMRSGWPISVIMLDVDHFKALNDYYGHLRGDECLTAVAQMLRRDLRRGGELLARYGGEEFVAVLPNVDVDGAIMTAEAMRLRVEQLSMENLGSPLRKLTISGGVCSMTPGPGTTRGRLVAAADTALYRAKSRGRNCVELAPAPQPLALDEETRPAVPGLAGQMAEE